MDRSFCDWIRGRYRLGHQRVMKVVEGLTDDQMRWRPTPTAHTIAWNTWHLARVADYLQARIPEMTRRLGEVLGPQEEIWRREGLAARWGLDAASLGWGEFGMGMDDGVAASLPLPEKAAVLDLARRAFAAAERSVAAIEDWEFPVPYLMPFESEPRPIGSFLISFNAHDELHRGQILCLRRAMNLPRVLA